MKSSTWSKKPILAAALASVLGFGAAQSQAYLILDDWDLNLSVVNGTNGVAGAMDATGIDEIIISGESIVGQTVVGGNPLGQPFVDDGYLQFGAYTPEAGGGLGFFDLGNQGAMYITFAGLTGILNGDGSITFDPNVGEIKLWLDTDNDLDINTGVVTELANFNIISPSGGSDLNFIGGGGQNATIDVTLEVLSTIAPGLFTDENGDDLGTIFFALVNTDSLLDGIDNSGLDEFGNGTSIITVSNAGQFNVAVVPEPATLSLFGLGLLGLGYSARKRRQS